MALFELSARAVTWTLAGLAGVGIAACAVLWWCSRGSRELRWPAWMLFGLVAASLLALPVYFYSTRWVSWPHHWDLFHTIMGAKYHREVGYFRLYACAVERDAQGPRVFRSVKRVRDLRTLRRVPRERVLEEARCAGRFTPERGEGFDRDLRYFQEHLPRGRWRRLLRDKGYNGSPFYTSVAGTIASLVPLTEPNVVALALIDPILILLAFASLGWAAGPRLALLALLFFTANFPNRFEHMGGSLLRFDYVAFLVMALAALSRGRHATAGALLTLSTMIRIFPAVFVAGYGVHAAVRAARERRVSSDALRFVVGCAVACAACLGFSLFVVGAGAWGEFLDNIRLHTSRVAAYRIGLKALFILDDRGRDWRWLIADSRHFVTHVQVLYWLACAPFVAALARLSTRLSALDYTVVFGLTTFYVFSVATRYYYSVLVVLFVLVLSQRPATTRPVLWGAAFVVSLSGFIVGELAVDPAFTYNVWMSASVGVFIAAMLVALNRGSAVTA